MAIDLGVLHQALRWVHVATGAIGLVLFWIPIFSKKGGKLHVRAGRLFAWCACIVGVTALFSSIWAMVDPASFVGSSFEKIPERSQALVVEQVRFFFAILGFLSILVLAGLWFGLRVLWTRDRHETLREPVLLSLQIVSGVASLALAVFGAWNLIAGYGGRHLLPAEEIGRYWIPLILGLLGVQGVRADLRYVLQPRPSRMAWWYKHVENMLGVGIAFHTAFLVFGANRVLKLYLVGPWALLPWLMPSLIGVPAIILWIRYYRRKFGELGQSRQAPSADANEARV